MVDQGVVMAESRERGDGGRVESRGEEEEEEGAEEAAEARDFGEQTDSDGLGVEELDSDYDSDSVGIYIACSPWRNRAAAMPRSSTELVRHRNHASSSALLRATISTHSQRRSSLGEGLLATSAAARHD